MSACRKQQDTKVDVSLFVLNCSPSILPGHILPVLLQSMDSDPVTVDHAIQYFQFLLESRLLMGPNNEQGSFLRTKHLSDAMVTYQEAMAKNMEELCLVVCFCKNTYLGACGQSDYKQKEQ